MKKNPDRVALADAIERVNSANKAIDEALAAEQNAQLHLSAAYEREERLNVALLEFAEPSKSELISHLATGADVVVRDGLAELKAKLAEVGKDIEKWRKLRDLARAEVDERRESLIAAQRKALAAADVVMLATIDVSGLLEETAELQGRVINNRTKLSLVSSLIEGPEGDRLRDFLRQPWLKHQEARLHPATQAMRDFRDRLLLDPNATREGEQG